MVFTGTIDVINTALDGMVFDPTPDYDGAASVQIITDDQGNTGSGGPLSDDDTVAITVNAINDPAVIELDADDSSGSLCADFDTICSEDGGAVACSPMSLRA